MNCAPEDAGVEVLGAALDLDEEVADAPEAVGQARLLLAQPVVVGDAHVVHVFHEGGVLPADEKLVEPL